MKNNFDKIFPDLIASEGGYSNDPDDHGGATKYGITIADVRKYVNKGATDEDVKLLTIDQAKVIYKQRYWDALDCDNLASGVDYTCFDYGVNSGLARPRKALETFKDKSGVELINAINDERTAFLKRLATRPGQDKFLRGWLNRVSRVRAKSLELAKDKVSGPAIAVVTGGIASATVIHQNMHFWNAHPYLTIAGVIGVAALVGYLVHLIRNAGNQNAVA